MRDAVIIHIDWLKEILLTIMLIFKFFLWLHDFTYMYSYVHLQQRNDRYIKL